MPVYGTGFLVRIFGADFWYVCHGHKSNHFQWTGNYTNCGEFVLFNSLVKDLSLLRLLRTFLERKIGLKCAESAVKQKCLQFGLENVQSDVR